MQKEKLAKTMWMVQFCICINIHTLSAQETTGQNLIIIRHGQATNNLENVYNSNPENSNYKPADLTHKGKHEAIRAARNLLAKGFKNENITVVLVSPLPRAKETADILVKEGVVAPEKIKVDNRLIEQQFGDLEGKPIFSIWKRSYEAEFHAESDEQLKKRIDDFYQGILKEYPEGNIVVITHSAPAQSILHKAIGRPLKLSTGEVKVIPIKKQ